MCKTCVFIFISNMEGWKCLINGFDVHHQAGVLARKLDIKFHKEKGDIVLCCILKGAAYFLVDLSRALESLDVNHSIYFIEASSYVHQTQAEHMSITREIVAEKFIDKHVVLIDELYDNGKTLKLGNNIRSLTTCVMFRKKKKEKPNFPQPDLIGFDDLPDVWLVGYGLDYDGLHRGSLALFAVPNEGEDEVFKSKEEYEKVKKEIKFLK